MPRSPTGTYGECTPGEWLEVTAGYSATWNIVFSGLTLRRLTPSLRLLIPEDIKPLDMPATVDSISAGVVVALPRRAHLPIGLASGLLNKPVSVPWRNGLPLRLTV